MTKLVIEIKNGNIVFIGSNTENVRICVIDHDIFLNDDQSADDEYEPDSIMTNEGISDYIAKNKQINS